MPQGTPDGLASFIAEPVVGKVEACQCAVVGKSLHDEFGAVVAEPGQTQLDLTAMLGRYVIKPLGKIGGLCLLQLTSTIRKQ